jgi:micrococcal nuclease
MRFIGAKRRLRLGVLTVVLIGLLAACGTNPNSQKDSFLSEIEDAYPELRGKKAETASVIRVVDGDTIEIGTGAKVRFIGVDTPEVHGKSEYYGAEASAYVKSMLKGQTVVLFKDVSETDRYGRLLRYVFIYGDPVMFNERLVREGYANTATFPPDVAFAERFAALEREARRRGVGLWGSSGAESQDASAPSVSANAQLPPASCENPRIKGNINAKGDRIYHVPGGASYEATKPEMMFCTEEEAAAAGFRKAAR